MAEAIIFPIANSIVKKLASFTGDRVVNLIDGEIRAAKSAKEDLKIIAEDLTAICAFIQDAEDKQYRNSTMNLWLQDLKTLVYDIDDLLDDVAIDALRRSLNKSHFFPQLRYYFSSANPLVSRFHLSHKIKDVRQKLERIVTRKTNFGLTDHLVEVRRPSRDLFNDISYVKRSSVVGRDEAKNQVKRSLLSLGDAPCPSVLPIVGMGGIGKTTLAKLVYDDICNEFDMKIWACVSDQFSLIKLLEDIIKDATGVNTSSNHTLGRLVNKLQDLLSGRKYLLVLDDVWVDDVAIWEELKSLVEVGKPGSVVLMTTRSRQVASITQTMEGFDLDRLSDETSWSIFSQLAFREGEEQKYPFQSLRYYFSSSNPLISRIHLSHKVKDVRLKLESIVAKKTKFDLTERPVEVSRPSKGLFNDISYVNRSSVVGRDGAKKQVMRKLLSVGDASRLSVLPIVGIGGIGKTTLAKLVYDDIRSEFDMNIWACVSDQFNLLKLLQDIVKDASDGVNTSNHTLGQLVNKVQDLLRGRKYMLVLDDVWVDDVAIWEELKSLLEVGKPGSVVGYDLDRLSDETSWSIFSQLVFREGEEQRNPFLCEIGRSIVEKCGGVPLVIKSLGSLLRRDRDEREWQRINNMDSFTKLPGEYSKVMQLLRISYDKLPSHLKTCFAYCSLKPRDVEFYATQLIYLWNAHGLLQLQDGNDDIEGCGFACAMDLVSRSLLEHPSFIFSETMFTCKIHDLMHELAEDVLGEELAVVTRNDLNVSESTKHVIWGYEGPDGLKGFEFPRELLVVANKARSFQFGYRMSNVSLSFLEGVIANFSYLRTLEIWDSPFEELPLSIGNLKHLRGLKLSHNPLLKTLPDTVCKLLKLESLDVDGCETLEKLPKKIYRLVKLRNLSVTTCLHVRKL